MDITIYTKEHCVMCDRTKKLLNAESISYNEIDLEGNPEVVNKMIEYGFQSAPIVSVELENGEKDMWCGFRVDKIKKVIELSRQSELVTV